MKSSITIKSILNSVSLCLLSAVTILCSVLYVNTFTGGFFYDNKLVLLSTVVVVVAVITIIALAYATTDKKTIYKISIVTLSIITFILLAMYVLKITGVSEKIKSVEDLRNYVASFGYLAIIIYIILNFLQVVLLPIPGVIAVGTGVALFGPFKTAIFSLLGILLGSYVAFFIGRILGYKVVKWIVGKETLDKWLNSVRKKDKIILTFMFLFPFFPDDVLCFVAGLSTMSTPYFIVMIMICRIISVFLSAYSMSGNIIPYTTWWGILLWILILSLTAVATVFLYKNGDRIQKFINKQLKIRRKSREGNITRRSK